LPNQGLNPCFLQQKHRVLTTGPPREYHISQVDTFYTLEKKKKNTIFPSLLINCPWLVAKMAFYGLEVVVESIISVSILPAL